jgi:hypothetical protein
MISFEDWKNNTTQGLYYYKYWDEEMFESLKRAKTFKKPLTIMDESLKVARELLNRLPSKLGVVCGPISTGKRSVEENLKIFGLIVLDISNKMPIFNQMPFEPVFEDIHSMVINNKEFCPSGKSSEFFIDYFYREVFLSGKEWAPHFIDGWEYSVGAVMEHDIFTQLGSDIVYLPENFVTP